MHYTAEWKPMDKHTVYVLWKTKILSLLHKFIIPFWFPECKPGSISGLLNGTWTFSSLHYPDIFPVYGMETGIFPFYGMKPENFSGLRNKYHGSGNFRFPFLKPENFGFLFIQKFPGIPLYGTNVQIISVS